jgi:hypothetical protein
MALPWGAFVFPSDYHHKSSNISFKPNAESAVCTTQAAPSARKDKEREWKSLLRYFLYNYHDNE